jgi:EAL domain-containing protein (putative c-di-GMP-specific phosphodiesterase class I)
MPSSAISQPEPAIMNTFSKPIWTTADLTTAVRRNEFIPYFQPKIDLSTGAASSVEMLARWDHPQRGILPPSQFIGLIESAGLIDRFTDNLMRKSLLSAADNAVSGCDLGIAVNFSALTLQDPRAVPRICAMVREYGIPFERITIELTESAAPNDQASLIRSLTLLCSQGFKISMDDFGTGFSSLALLNAIPFTELKIDQMFVAGIHINKKLTAILETIMHLAAKLHLRTVAEGIETAAQLDFIRALGCDVGQGFYFGRPARTLESNCGADRARLLAA